jgi:hypothetical protein
MIEFIFSTLFFTCGGLLLDHNHLYWGVICLLAGNNFMTGVWKK